MAEQQLNIPPPSGATVIDGALPAALEDDKIHINRVSIRTPPFCKDRPALWFASLESQFVINGITQESTKFHYAIAHLDTDCTKEVEEIILQPPATNPYTTLKNAIISQFSVSYEEKVRRLLEQEQMGDRKPSSFFRYLRSLAGPAFPDQLLKTIWSNRLPRQVQIVLAAQQQQTITELADLADKLSEISAQPSEVHQVTGNSPSSSLDSNGTIIAAIQKQVADLTLAVAALTDFKNRPSRPRSRSTSRHRNHSQSSLHNDEYCWYHNCFGPRATKCIHPCTWSNKKHEQGNASSGR